MSLRRLDNQSLCIEYSSQQNLAKLEPRLNVEEVKQI